MTYHPYDTYYVLAMQGDSRASWHYKYDSEKGIAQQRREEASNIPVNLTGCHPQDTYGILARQGDARAAGHHKFNRKKFVALQRAEGK